MSESWQIEYYQYPEGLVEMRVYERKTRTLLYKAQAPPRISLPDWSPPFGWPDDVTTLERDTPWPTETFTFVGESASDDLHPLPRSDEGN